MGEPGGNRAHTGAHGLISPRRLLFSLGIALCALAGLEAFARLLPDTISGRREIVQDPPGRGEAMVSSEEVPGWDLTFPGGVLGGMQAYTTNHWRMRGPDYPDVKPANAVRVIFVGDSSIFGFLLEWEDTFSAKLEALREGRFPDTDFQVANCAAPGHSSVQSLYKLQGQCLAFQPDIVVIGNLNSDASHWTETDRDRFHLASFTGPGRQLQRSALYRTLRNAWLTLQIRGTGSTTATEIPQLNHGANVGEGPRRVPPDEYRENLRELVRLSREAGASPMFLVLPNKRRNIEHDPEDPAIYREIMRTIAAEERAPIADADAFFQTLPGGMDGLFLDPVHPDKLGATLIAREIDKAMGELR